MSVKCEEPIDELKVVWLLCHPQTLIIGLSKREGITDRQAGGWRDGRSNYRCPRRTFQDGGMKKFTIACMIFVVVVKREKTYKLDHTFGTGDLSRDCGI